MSIGKDGNSVAVQVIARRMAGGQGHEHISMLRWTNGQETKNSTRADMVTWVKGGGQAYVSAGGYTAYLRVRESSTGTEYVQTYADGDWKDNLLALPTF
jgi:hypothetical protein